MVEECEECRGNPPPGLAKLFRHEEIRLATGVSKAATGVSSVYFDVFRRKCGFGHSLLFSKTTPKTNRRRRGGTSAKQVSRITILYLPHNCKESTGSLFRLHHFVDSHFSPVFVARAPTDRVSSKKVSLNLHWERRVGVGVGADYVTV